MSEGKLIVLEGIDGSGKSTQYKLLCERFQKEGIQYHSIVFPRYQKESSALLRMYLNGEFGKNPSDVNACAASAFYAVDRYASYKQEWGALYEKGELIFSDRYTTSNAVHQGSKVPDEALSDFFDWLYDFEYMRLGLPRPDLVIYLEVDIKTATERLRHRQEKTKSLGDIHEQDAAYLRRCLRTGELAADHYGWRRIPFMKNEKVREKQEKSEEIFELIKKLGLI